MEHHQCYRVYITRTQATRVSNIMHFKHQYITNPTIAPEFHVVAAAQQLAHALMGNILAGNKMVEALTKVSKLLTKMGMAKQATAQTFTERNALCSNPAARKMTHLPRVASPPPRVESPLPRVEALAP
jgi:hypothetical protein